MAKPKPLPKPTNTLSDKAYKKFLFGTAKANETRSTDQVVNDTCRQNRWRDQ
jgi:hypothetical protein